MGWGFVALGFGLSFGVGIMMFGALAGWGGVCGVGWVGGREGGTATMGDAAQGASLKDPPKGPTPSTHPHIPPPKKRPHPTPPTPRLHLRAR